jgi:hypothetical protein
MSLNFAKIMKMLKKIEDISVYIESSLVIAVRIRKQKIRINIELS